MELKYKDLSQEDQDKWYELYHQSTVQVRGAVLNAVTALEMAIDLYITDHFTNDVDKSEELMNLIISPRMTFENKVQALLVLIERHKPKILEENNTMANDLQRIAQERNVIAHYPLDTTPWGLQTYFATDDITLFKFKNVKESEGDGKKKEIKLTNSIRYNERSTLDLLNLIDKYHKVIAFNIESG